MADNKLEQRLNQLEQELKTLKQIYAIHQHNGIDGTNTLRKNIRLDRDQAYIVGDVVRETVKAYSATDGFNYISATVVGEYTTPGIVLESPNMQVLYTHIPEQASLFSFLTAERNPLVVSSGNTSISTTLGGSTVTIAGYDFTTNELAGAYIDIYNSSGVLIETQTIASNTSTVITISGTWLASTSGGTFKIYTPVFLGRTDTVFRRLYVEEGTASGGVRFGVGPTANGQNGLLYMDAAGDLYWRNKSGTSVKLN